MSRRPKVTSPNNSERRNASRGHATIVDPSENHLERSRRVFAAYDRAVSAGAADAGYLSETNYEGSGLDGNQRSRQAFDPDTFRRG